MSDAMWAAVPPVVFGALVVVFFAVAMRRIWREERARFFAREQLACDGSAFWGRKQAEATQGKVVTKESGGSREQAAKALAEAERESGREVVVIGPYVFDAADPVAVEVARLVRERDAARGRFDEMRNERNEAYGDLRRQRERAELAEAELYGTRGALTECRRELAEARAAQAVPVPSVTDTHGGNVWSVRSTWHPIASFDKDASPLIFTADSAGDPVWQTPPSTDGTAS